MEAIKCFNQAGPQATLQEHQGALQILLQEFDRVCKALNIPYFLFAGTLLGAVRHQGFIPWDDDVDVLMLRKDYRRFMEEAPGILNSDLFYLQQEHSKHWPMFFSKLRLNGTTCLEKYHPKDPQIHQGVYMDIFPCDNAFESEFGRRVQFISSKVVIAKGLDRKGYETDSKTKKVFMAVCRVLPGVVFQKLVEGPKNTGSKVHCFLGGASKYEKSLMPASCFSHCCSVSFAGKEYSAPADYSQVLQILYGDYMKIPPPEERVCKEHALLVDLTRDQSHYEGYRDNMKFAVYTRSIR